MKLTIKKIIFSLSICFLVSCATNSINNYSIVSDSLKNGLFRNYAYVKASGYCTGDGNVSASYKIEWSPNSYSFSVKKDKIGNPSLSQFWLEKLGLLTESTTANGRSIINHSNFVIDSSQYSFSLSEEGRNYLYQWDRSTCLLLKYSATYPSGEEATYNYVWSK